MKQRVNAIDVPDGPVKPTPRKKVKRCRYCQKQLSQYNENEFCFAHTVKGFQMLVKIEEEKKLNTYKAQKRFISRKNAEKRKQKRVSGDGIKMRIMSQEEFDNVER